MKLETSEDPFDCLLAAGAQARVPDGTNLDQALAEAMVAGQGRTRAVRRNWAFALGSGLALALGLGVFLADPGRSPPAAEPTVLVVPEPVGEPPPLRAPAPSILQLRTGDRIALEGEAQVAIEEQRDDLRRVRLTGGAAAFDVRRRGADQHFVVVTPHLRVNVLGTVFTVSVDDVESRVEVHEGRVEVVSDGEAVELEAGGGISSRDGVAEPATGQGSVFGAFVRLAVAARRDEPPPIAERAPPTLSILRRWLRERRYRDVLRTCERAQRREDLEWLVLEGDAARGAGQTARAAQLLSRASERASPTRAVHYGYQAAQLFVREGQEARAIEVLERSRADAPASPLEERALFLRAQALSRLHRGAEVRAVARRYLMRFPAGEARQWMDEAASDSATDAD